MLKYYESKICFRILNFKILCRNYCIPASPLDRQHFARPTLDHCVRWPAHLLVILYPDLAGAGGRKAVEQQRYCQPEPSAAAVVDHSLRILMGWGWLAAGITEHYLYSCGSACEHYSSDTWESHLCASCLQTTLSQAIPSPILSSGLLLLLFLDSSTVYTSQIITPYFTQVSYSYYS